MCIFSSAPKDGVIAEGENPSVKNVSVRRRHGADFRARIVDMGGPLHLLAPYVFEHYPACKFCLKQPEVAHEKSRGYSPHYEMAVRRLLIHIAIERRRVPDHIGACPAANETHSGPVSTSL
jgi:hypothetical protein